ncbi:hypothetical protein HPB49_011201 [Dermacentor silvarum]|uniref:Uncharacterized protein n=1 Tax=Dermacentor silvarum TaxID=543639 RepID=A0ACB8D4E2_DERSI|nr:uncharacterized protein LOC119445198 [Dermacentor silvarum]KAH7959442.1 hypothetical protein HPB49_011201 [Dermacentor silvarum]
MIPRRLLRFRRRRCLLMLMAVLGVLLLGFKVYLRASRSASHPGSSGSSGGRRERPVPVDHRIRTSGCTMPQFDPFDPSVKPYFHHHLEGGGSCCQGKPNFLTIRNGFAVILEDKLGEHGVRPEDLLCFYKEIHRNQSAASPENVIAYGDRQPLLLNQPLKEEFVSVECATRQSPHQTFHNQYLLNVVVKRDVEERCLKSNRTTLHNLSVLMLGLDSVSYLNLDRHMPKTAQFLRERLGAFELRGYNKIGDNSYPNQHALITGLKFAETWRYALEGIYDSLTWRFIWQQYGERCYRTMFLEDWPLYGIFYRFANGFRRPPADYYPRHVIMAMEKSSKWITKDTWQPRCLGPTRTFEEMLDYIARFTDAMGERHFFAYVWINEITHNYLNAAGYADEPFQLHLQALQTSGVLDHTVLVFLSDHGLRFGDYRSTYIGKFEDRQPFAFVVFPPWFLEQNPEAARSLRVNQFRLTTPFDVHATLVELLDYPSVKRPHTKYGLSLLHEIPEARTCADAHIGPHWCACNVRGEVSVSSTLALAMANRLVTWINGLVALAMRKCAEYQLHRIMDVTALQVTPSERAHNTSHYWVTVELLPGYAVFEGTVRVTGDAITALNDISRNDRCTMMSYCVWTHWLEKYCYCLRTVGQQM